ncbi:hypothetical protein [Pontibacter populi]|uniref:Uncharacterized protein n=1 Tax=Pontibacter populi TaxID=890055 RepID=A0ABV1RX26_9BACT
MSVKLASNNQYSEEQNKHEPQLPFKLNVILEKWQVIVHVFL